MRIEEFTQQGFEECPPEFIPSLRNPFNEDSNFYIKEILESRPDFMHHIVVEENGAKSKLKVLHSGVCGGGWLEHIMDLNIE